MSLGAKIGASKEQRRNTHTYQKKKIKIVCPKNKQLFSPTAQRLFS